MPSEDRKIKDSIFHYQLIEEREYPVDYFLDIQFVTYFFSSISNILSLLLFPPLPTCSPWLSSFPACLYCDALPHDLPNSFLLHCPLAIPNFLLPHHPPYYLPEGERNLIFCEAGYLSNQSSDVDPCQPSNVVNSLEKTEQLLNSNKRHDLL